MDGIPEEGRRASVAGELRDGVLVAQSYADTGAVLAAGLEAQARIDLAGLVNVFQDPENFELVHVPAYTDKQRTEFIGGTHAELGPGVELAATGYLEEGGKVFLERVQFLSAAAKRTPVGEISLSAPLQAVDPAAGTLTVLDFEFETDAATVFYDFQAHTLAFDLEHLAANDWITVSGLPPQAGAPLLAANVQRDRMLPNRQIRVKGPASDIDSTHRTLRILGIPVRAMAGTLYIDDRPPVDAEPPPPPPPENNGGEGGEAPPPPPPPPTPSEDDGAPPSERAEISAAEFFQTAPESDFVTVYGRFDGDVLVAAELILAP